MLHTSAECAHAYRTDHPSDELFGGTGQQRCRELSLNIDYLRGCVTDAGNVLACAVPSRPMDWLKSSLVLAATLRLADEDEDIQAWLQARRDGRSNTVAGIGKPFGDGKFILPALGVAYFYGRFSQDRRLQRTALLGCESVVVSGAITGVIKYLSHKQRPSSGVEDDIPWAGPALATAHVSFPSGHSACAFALGTVLALEYGDKTLVAPVAYGAATLCAFSRLNDNAHWLSDVIVGAAIGHLTAKAIVRRHGGRYSAARDQRP